METMYQRSRIQEESLYYETLKHTGEYPIIGVNTFLSSKGSPTVLPKEVIRATEEEKEAQIRTVENVQQAYAEEGNAALRKLQEAAIKNENMFAVLMEATKYCSLGQLTAAMFEVGGQYQKEHVGRLGVPVRKASPSRSSVQVLAGLPAPGFPLRSLTRNSVPTITLARCPV
ncbi:MAG: hypothetical protein IPL52_01615 [Flavobacteriales bacterium]|nr:hypothetical protein [Flavobacteriales bacterium]